MIKFIFLQFFKKKYRIFPTDALKPVSRRTPPTSSCSKNGKQISFGFHGKPIALYMPSEHAKIKFENTIQNNTAKSRKIFRCLKFVKIYWKQVEKSFALTSEKTSQNTRKTSKFSVMFNKIVFTQIVYLDA